MALVVKTIKRLVLMARSEMAGKHVPCDFGVFDSVEDAERFGASWFKTLTWLVGEEVTRLRDNGEVEVEYSYKSPVFQPTGR